MDLTEKYLNERLGEKGRTKPEDYEERGVRKLGKALMYLEITIKHLADSRKFDIYTKEGMKASKEEIQDLTKLKKELTARISNFG
jgi:hypothetical protein